MNQTEEFGSKILLLDHEVTNDQPMSADWVDTRESMERQHVDKVRKRAVHFVIKLQSFVEDIWELLNDVLLYSHVCLQK